MRVGVDADLRRHRHRLAGDRFGVHAVDVDQRARRGQRVLPARANADQAVIRLEHVAIAGQQQRHLGVGDRHHGLEPPQIAVRAPVLGELHGSPHQLTGMPLELGLEPLEQGEGIRRATGEPRHDLAVAEATHLARGRLQDRALPAHLTIAGNHHVTVRSDRQDGRAVPGLRPGLLHSSSPRRSSRSRPLMGRSEDVVNPQAQIKRCGRSPRRGSRAGVFGLEQSGCPHQHAQRTHQSLLITHAKCGRCEDGSADQRLYLIEFRLKCPVLPVQLGDARIAVRQLVVDSGARFFGHLGYLGTKSVGSLDSDPLQKSHPRRLRPTRANGGREAPSDLTLP